ncbi:hypothetical protein GH844_27265 [Bacillus thuringiensis]|nr:hypothetical protein [Bacillus thuringiensis]
MAKEIESTEDGFIQWMLVMQYDGLAQEAINEGSITQEEVTAIAREYSPTFAK